MRTQIFANSIIPSCVAVWNSLPEELRYSESIATFKCNLTNTYFKVEPTPLHYLVGSSKLSVLLALEMYAVTYPLTNSTTGL